MLGIGHLVFVAGCPMIIFLTASELEQRKSQK